MREIRVGSYEAKTRFAELLGAVDRGDEVVITRRGIPVARLLAYETDRVAARRAAIETWRRQREGILPLGMTMREAIDRGRTR